MSRKLKATAILAITMAIVAYTTYMSLKVLPDALEGQEIWDDE